MLLKPIQVAAPIWATKYYVWVTRFQFLGAQVATKALKSICSTEYYDFDFWYMFGFYTYTGIYAFKFMEHFIFTSLPLRM